MSPSSDASSTAPANPSTRTSASACPAPENRRPRRCSSKAKRKLPCAESASPKNSRQSCLITSRRAMENQPRQLNKRTALRLQQGAVKLIRQDKKQEKRKNR